MEVEDDMIVLVVVDDETKLNKGSDGLNLEELGIPGDVVKVHDIIQTAEKHGHYIDVKLGQMDSGQNEHLENEMPAEIDFNTEPEDTQITNDGDVHTETDEDKSDVDYEPQIECIQNRTVRKTSDSSGRRLSMLKPWQQRSFIAELREEYEELNEDEDLLVKTLEQVMRTVKPPPLPKDYYVASGMYYECTNCGAKLESIPAAGRHYQEKHGQRYLVCYACGVDFRSKTNLYKHEKRCLAPDARLLLKARAAHLGKKGRNRPDLPLDVCPPRKITRFPCKLCSAVFTTRNILRSHENLHRGERPFRCHVCPAAYTSSAGLYRHIKKHSDEEYICDHCKRSFKLKAALVAHMDTHQPVRKHLCAECGQRFAQKSALQLHVDRVHRHLPPPCACQICPKRYPRMSLLKVHMKRVHGMTIISRKMFLKSLPSMTEMEVKPSKIVLKSEGENLGYDLIP